MSAFLNLNGGEGLELVCLEERIALSRYLPYCPPSVAIVRVVDDAPKILTPGDNDVTASGARILTTDLTLTRSIRIGGTGMDKVTDLKVWDDVNGNGKLDRGDKEIAGLRRQDRNGLTLYPWFHYNLPYRDGSLLVTFDVKKDAAPGKVAIGVKAMDFQSLYGWWRPVYTYHYGSPSVDTIAAKSATLSVVSKNIGTTDTVVRGEQRTAYALEMRATDGDVRLTSIPLIAKKGNLIDGQTYTLNANGTTVTGTVRSGLLSFDTDILIRNGSTVRLTVDVTIAQSITSNRVLQLDIDDRTGIKAEDARTGRTLGGANLQVYHDPGITLKIVDQGSVFIRKSSVPVQSKHLLMGERDDVVARYTVRAQDETGLLKKMRLWVKGNATTVDRFDVYLSGDTLPRFSLTKAGYGTDAPVTGYTGFANGGLLSFPLPEGDTEFIIKIVTKTDVEGGVRGEPVQIEMRGEWNPLDVVGDVSKRNFVRNDGDTEVEGEYFVGVNAAGPNLPIVSAVHVTVGAELAAALPANVTPFGSAIPTGLSVLGEVKLVAEANANSRNGLDALYVDQMTFRVRIGNAAVDSAFWLYNKADSSVRTRGYVTDLAGNVLNGTIRDREVLVHFINIRSGSVNVQISSGEQATFVLAGTVTDPQGSPTEPSAIDVWSNFGYGDFAWINGDFGGPWVTLLGTDLPDDEVLIGSYRSA